MHRLLDDDVLNRWCADWVWHTLQRRVQGAEFAGKKTIKRRRGPNQDRQRDQGHKRLMKDYFDPVHPTYNDEQFRRRYRMSRRLFWRIQADVCRENPYFQKVNQKCAI